MQYTQPENADRSIISTESYMKRKGELEAGKRQAEEKLADLSQRVSNFMKDTEEKFDFAVTALRGLSGVGMRRERRYFAT